METSYSKGSNGQCAETTVALEGTEYTFKMSTSKNFNGQLVTSASCCIIEQHDGYKTYKHAVFGDYFLNITRATKRCTAKAVKTQHEEALIYINDYINDAKMFYAEKHNMEACK